MNDCYTVLWTNDRCKLLEKAGDEGHPLSVLFGGIHQSAPSYKRVKVESGDYVYPLRFYKRTLFVIARIKVKAYIGFRDYVVKYCNLTKDEINRLNEYEIVDLLNETKPDLGQFLPYGCGIEVLIGEEGTFICFDNAVLPELLEKITFCTKNERQKLKYVENGQLTNSISLQGNIRRLYPESAKEFDKLIEAK